MKAPKICVVIAQKDDKAIFNEVNKANEYHYDLIEWRLDYYDDYLNIEKVKEVIIKLKKLLDQNNKKLLITLRTCDEGGLALVTKDEYLNLYQELILSKEIDLIDVEFNQIRDDESLIDLAHQHQVEVILSKHDFEKVPSQNEMRTILEKMQQYQADLNKLAVMAHNEGEANQVVDLIKDFSKQATNPFIVIAMGKYGQRTRMPDKSWQAPLLYTNISEMVAPGQVSLAKLNEIYYGDE